MSALMNRATMAQPIRESTLTCPRCGHQKTELMPTDSCLYYYECESCHAVLKPEAGDCCVFCSYGTVKCPSMQQGGNRPA